jgi:glucose-1-phosphate cytidylyltransferase
MKLVILAGGLGSRISEESHLKPKPLIEIGGKPILWHIMKHYSHFGVNEFVICCGYKGYLIKEYFANYFLHTSDVTFDLGNNEATFHHSSTENWKVTLVDTGEGTMTGGRIKKISDYINDEVFFLTYGDGLSNVNIDNLLNFHKSKNKLVTVTAVIPPGRFGSLAIRDKSDEVTKFVEKPDTESNYINGGFFVVNKKAIDYIENNETSWEKEPLEQISSKGQLVAFKHEGFWQPMDTIREKNHLEELWFANKAPWRIWSE